MHAFEKLEVWKKARELTKEVYLTTKMLPDDERYGLTSQLRRAIISVSSNIAEGATRLSGKDQSRFYEIAYGSLMELLNQLILAVDLEYLDGDELKHLRERIDEISRMLNALYRSARN